MRRYRKGVRLALLGLVSAVVAGGVIGVTPVKADPTNFVVAVQKNPPTLEPMRENSNAQMRVLYSIAETLISIDFKQGFGLIPGLATEWKRLDDQTLEFKLRKGVKFHNGEEMTAEDVAFTFGQERFLGEDAPGWPVAKQYLGVIESTEIIDDYTIRIKSRTPDPLLEQRFANYMSEIISKKAYLDAGDWDKWSRNVVATGPYKLVEMKTGEYIKLEAFDGYWGEKAPAKTVTFKVVPEVAARIAGLTTGEYDIASEIPPDQLKGIDDTKGIEAAGGPIRNIRAINYDETNARLSDPRIRRALNLAIDRQLIVDTLYHGRTSVPRGMQQELFADMYIEDWPELEYNPDKAKALLEEAGYKGEEIYYRVLSDYYTLEVSTAQILVEMWKAVGLNVQLQIKENWDQITEDNESRHIFNSSNTAVIELFADMYIEDWPELEYNPDKAKALLEEAGYKGEEIYYRVLSDYYTLEVSTAQILVEMWKAVGLNVQLQIKENWDQITEDNESRHIFNSSNTAVYPDPVGQLWRRFGPKGWYQGQKAFVNAEFNVQGEILETSTDLATRRAAFRRMLEIYHVEDPAAQ